MDLGLTMETVLEDLLVHWLDVEYEEKMPPECLYQAHGGGRTICRDGQDSERWNKGSMWSHYFWVFIKNIQVHMKTLSSGQMYYR